MNQTERTPERTWWDCVKNDMENLGLSRVHFSTRKKRKVPVNYAFLKWTTGDATHLKITCMRSATHLK